MVFVCLNLITLLYSLEKHSFLKWFHKKRATVVADSVYGIPLVARPNLLYTIGSTTK